jgi:putative membrane protein
MTREALLAYAHFLAIFGLASVLVAELILFRQTMPGSIFRRLQMVDRWYGIVAVLVIITGLARLYLGFKGVGYYHANPIFWTKMGLFAVVGLLSVPPTIAFIRWKARVAADGSLALEPAEYGKTHALLWLEIAVFLFIPLCATFMARGFR